MSEAPLPTGPETTTDAPKGSEPAPENASSASSRGPYPDPVIGAGMTLLGIFVMGVAGAAQAHYAFNAGTLVACVGAVAFVLLVALSALQQRKPAPNGG